MPNTGMYKYDEKRQNFDRLMEPRLERAVKAVGLLKNLNDKSNYAWTPPLSRYMIEQLYAAVGDVAQAFGEAPRCAPKATSGEGGSGVVTTPSPEPNKPAPEPRVSAVLPVDDRDRRDIRRALLMLQACETAKAAELLQSIVCGWVVPDNVEEE